MVKTKKGEIVFSLTADDFTLSDNGVPQTVHMESDIDAQPMALVIVVQTGGHGAAHLNDYNNLGAVIDAVIGDVPHHVAVVNFDSTPHLAQDFSTNTDVATRLFVSPRTVQTHLTHVYTKLGLTSRVHLVQEAARHA